MASPVFSLHPLDSDNALSPEENDLVGTSIRLCFDYEPAYEERLPLYIYSEAATFKVEIIYKGKDSKVLSVEIL
jgi:hypothetical protein